MSRALRLAPVVEAASGALGQTVREIGRLMETENVAAEEPEPRPYGVSAEEAVELCREWMIYLGATDTLASSGETRELCDLYSSRYLAWVDNGRGNLDADAVETAAKLAASDGRKALIFMQSGVRPIAQQLADTLGVALLNYNARDGSLAARSRLARDIRVAGLTKS